MDTIQKVKLSIYGALGVILLIAGIAINPLVTIGTGERGVVLAFGAFKGEVMDPGLHFRTPFVEDVVEINVQTQKIERETIAYSKDLQQVTVKLALNYALEAAQVGTLYQNIGLSFESKIIEPSIEESVKQAVSKFTAEELISRRGEVKEEIKAALKARLQTSNIVAQEFSITDFSFSDQYEAAVEAKQVAEQRAKEQINITLQEGEKKKQEILKAEALAEKTRLEATALANQANAENLVKKLEAEALLKAAEKWNGVLPTQMIPGGSVPFLNLNLR